MLTGPHTQLLMEMNFRPFHGFRMWPKGEFEIACLKIAQGSNQKVFDAEPVQDVDYVNGVNFALFRQAGSHRQLS